MCPATATAPLCSAGSCAITVDHLQEAFWGSRLIGHNWQELILHQFPSAIDCVHVTFLSNPHHDLEVHSLAVIFGWGLSWRQTFWGNKWLGGNDFPAKKVVAQSGKWIGTLSTKQNCHCLGPMVLYHIPCVMWEQKHICTGLDGWFPIQKFLECCLFANTKNAWSCITSCEGVNKRQLGKQVTTQDLFQLTDVLHFSGFGLVWTKIEASIVCPSIVEEKKD